MLVVWVQQDMHVHSPTRDTIYGMILPTILISALISTLLLVGVVQMHARLTVLVAQRVQPMLMESDVWHHLHLRQHHHLLLRVQTRDQRHLH